MAQVEEESGARTRTRQAIITAAVAALAADAGASLGDIAVAAGVGRTTLHRYFAERTELLAAVSQDCGRALDDAQRRARLDEGSGREAVLRLSREYVDLGDVMSLIFHEVVTFPEDPTDPACVDDPLARTILRGHDDGSIDLGQPVEWVIDLVWCAMYAVWSWNAGPGRSRHDGLALLQRSLDGALAPR